ncbi:MAG: hypothetical protein HZC28_20485 [Spirochaetes bacterium]|nr:hypothetical protein [Spirochaetota bacterium]
MTCCNSSGQRGLALALTFLATADRAGLRINTFAPCFWKTSVNGTPVTVSLAGAFPAALERHGTMMSSLKRTPSTCSRQNVAI